METIRLEDKSITDISNSFRDTVRMVRTNIYNIGALGALAAEKKLKLIQSMVSANDKEVKKFAWFENDD